MRCEKCKKVVNKKDHYVKLSTLNRPNNEPDENAYFHFKCFVDFFNDGVTKKARAEVENMRLVAMKIMKNPMIQSVLQSIGGGDQLQQMLGTPLVKPEIITIVNDRRRIGKNEIAKKIDDDRKKREKGKTKSRSK